jgi:simple sugar transport system ATP-binding protein
MDLAARGSAVVVISQDLDELFTLSNRIAVLSEGQLSEPKPAEEMTVEEVGLLMGGLHDLPSESQESAHV